MRFVTYRTAKARTPHLALQTAAGLLTLDGPPVHVPDLLTLLRAGPAALQQAARLIERHGRPVPLAGIEYLPPVPAPGKIICVGLNYIDHTKESNFEQPDYPTLFLRLPGSVVGHEQAIVRPACSTHFDYEGEMVAFIGQGGRRITKERALEHIAGYAIGNEGSIRDYQFKSPQWTVGKNFDQTGSIGPAFVSADELPAGGSGLAILTRINGETVQSANTGEMVFDLATIVSLVSEAMTLEPGDVVFSGTPAGVGFARRPPLFLKGGDRVEVEIEGVGVLRNLVADEPADPPR